MRKWSPFALALTVALCAAAVGAAAPSGSADLRVTIVDGPDPVPLGTPLTYTIQVQNLGPEAATGVVLGDSLPNGLGFVSATASQGACAAKGRKVDCQLGTIAASSAPVTVSLTAIPRKSGTVSNTASVDGVEKDPNAANDKATATTTVLGPSATCHGVAVTILGTGGDDRLFGTSARDVISAFGGDDSIVSLGGRDLICAGRGSDRIASGGAADSVFAGAGRDRLLGRGGPDALRGGAGGDVLKGHAGADRLLGGAGTDRCVGGGGVDSVRGCEL